MTETPYTKRELDEKFSRVHEKLDEQTKVLVEIQKQTTLTNGKVRKVVLAIVAIGSLLIGAGFNQLVPYLSLLL